MPTLDPATIAMKTGNEERRLGETHYAVTVNGIVRYVGNLPHNDGRAADQGCGRHRTSLCTQRLESGGPAGYTRKRTEGRPSAGAFVLPTDIEASAFAEALRAKLGNGDTDDALYPLERKKLGGRVVLHGRHILRLGDGRYDKGRAYLHGLIKDQRARRWRTRFAVRR